MGAGSPRLAAEFYSPGDDIHHLPDRRRAALVPVADLPNYWVMSAAEYVAATGTPTGWRWLALAGRSDIMNLVASPASPCDAGLLREAGAGIRQAARWRVRRHRADGTVDTRIGRFGNRCGIDSTGIRSHAKQALRRPGRVESGCAHRHAPGGCRSSRLRMV